MLESELISKLLSHPIKLHKNSVTISHKLPEKANCQFILLITCINVISLSAIQSNVKSTLSLYTFTVLWT